MFQKQEQKTDIFQTNKTELLKEMEMFQEEVKYF